MIQRPGAELANRPLHFFYLCDCSGSMSVKGKMDSLNHAIAEALPHMKEVAAENPNADVLVRSIKFSNQAHWHTQEPTPLEDFVWSNIDNPAGLTSMGEALSMLAVEMAMDKMGSRALPPVIVLISDGLPTDDFEKSRLEFMKLPWAKKSVRLAIAIGEEADKDTLQSFIGEEFRNELEPLEANNPEQLVNYIKWASTVAIQAASSPTIDTQESNVHNISSQPPSTEDDIVSSEQSSTSSTTEVDETEEIW